MDDSATQGRSPDRQQPGDRPDKVSLAAEGGRSEKVVFLRSSGFVQPGTVVNLAAQMVGR